MKKQIIDKDFLYDLYIVQEYSTHEIAEMLKVSAQKIHNDLKAYNIQTRQSGSTTKRQRKKMSEQRIGEKAVWFGKKRPQHSVRMKIAMKGRIISDEAKIKMSKAKIGLTGPMHNKWIDPEKRKGTLYYIIRRLKEMHEWRVKVFIRDNKTCQMCGGMNRKIQADHIKPFCLIVEENSITNVQEALLCEELWSINNGRTLCVDCHRKTDSYGIKSRKYLKRYKK